eukprot:2473604-Rhodomonas_salina.1
MTGQCLDVKPARTPRYQRPTPSSRQDKRRPTRDRTPTTVETEHESQQHKQLASCIPACTHPSATPDRHRATVAAQRPLLSLSSLSPSSLLSLSSHPPPTLISPACFPIDLNLAIQTKPLPPQLDLTNTA